MPDGEGVDLDAAEAAANSAAAEVSGKGAPASALHASILELSGLVHMLRAEGAEPEAAAALRRDGLRCAEQALAMHVEAGARTGIGPPTDAIIFDAVSTLNSPPIPLSVIFVRGSDVASMVRSA